MYFKGKGDDAVEGDTQLQQQHVEQVVILQRGGHDVVHGVHQVGHGGIVGFVIVFADSLGLDDLLQSLLGFGEDAHIPAGGGADGQLDFGGGANGNGHIDPNRAAVHVHFHAYGLGEGQGRLHRQDDPPVLHDGDGGGNADPGGYLAAGNGKRHRGLAGHQPGGSPRQGINALAIEFIQLLLGFRSGHHGNQHLGLQFLVIFHLTGQVSRQHIQVILGQFAFQAHILGGVHIKLRQVILRVGVGKADIGAAFRSFAFQNLGEEHVAVEIALGVGGYILLVPADLAVVEGDQVAFVKSDLAVQDDAAGQVLGLLELLGIFALLVQDLLIPGRGGFGKGGLRLFLFLDLGDGLIVHNIVPEDVVQVLGEDDVLDLLFVNGYHAGVGVVGTVHKAHAVGQLDGKGGAGLKALLAVLFVAAAVEGEAAVAGYRGDGGLRDTGAGDQLDAAQQLLRGHGPGHPQRDAAPPVQVFKGRDVAVLGYLLGLVGYKVGVQGDVLGDGLAVGEDLRASFVRAPAAEGIALLLGADLLDGPGQQGFALAQGQGFQRLAAHGVQGDMDGFSLRDKPGVQGGLPFRRRVEGAGLGQVLVRIPGGEHIAFLGGVLLREGENITRLGGFRPVNLAVRHEEDQEGRQHRLLLRARLQGLGAAVGGFQGHGALAFVQHGAVGRRQNAFRVPGDPNKAQGAVALDAEAAVTLQNDLRDPGVFVQTQGYGFTLLGPQGQLVQCRAVEHRLAVAFDAEGLAGGVCQLQLAGAHGNHLPEGQAGQGGFLRRHQNVGGGVRGPQGVGLLLIPYRFIGLVPSVGALGQTLGQLGNRCLGFGLLVRRTLGGGGAFQHQIAHQHNGHEQRQESSCKFVHGSSSHIMDGLFQKPLERRLPGMYF